MFFGLDVLDDSYAYMMFASLCVYVSIRLDFRALFGLWESKIFDFFVLWGFFLCVQFWMEMKLLFGDYCVLYLTCLGFQTVSGVKY